MLLGVLYPMRSTTVAFGILFSSGDASGVDNISSFNSRFPSSLESESIFSLCKNSSTHSAGFRSSTFGTFPVWWEPFVVFSKYPAVDPVENGINSSSLLFGDPESSIMMALPMLGAQGSIDSTGRGTSKEWLSPISFIPIGSSCR